MRSALCSYCSAWYESSGMLKDSSVLGTLALKQQCEVALPLSWCGPCMVAKDGCREPRDCEGNIPGVQGPSLEALAVSMFRHHK